MELKEFFTRNPQAAIAFSGGVDSAYLLYAARKYARRVKAYYVKTPFQPRFELEDALRLQKDLDADVEVIEADVLCHKEICDNPKNRCYYCKKVIFSTILQAAARDGFSLLLDGTNASDDPTDRPGIRALRELSVRSPLQEAGLTKAEIRLLSKKAGLFTWDKPAYACLATRIPAGELITGEKLQRTELAEGYLHTLGLRDFRVRTMGEDAKLQVRAEDLPLVMEKREEIRKELSQHYSHVLLDLEVRHAQ